MIDFSRENTSKIDHKWSEATDKVVSYWKNISKNQVHLDDIEIINSRDFAVDLFPVPWSGPLRTAKAFFLFLNPGLSPRDREEEAKEHFANALRANLIGNEPYFYLLNENKSHPGHNWARATFGSDINEIYANEICVIQLVPYHSEKGDVARRVAAKLPSSKIIQTFVKENILPRALRGEVGLVVARSSKLWGIEEEHQNIIIYRGSECRRAFQTSGTRGGKMLRKIINNQIS